ncbi:MAG: RelA/SpoT domain-containing protein [Candidatus Neomarinimicrobiota bacterium]
MSLINDYIAQYLRELDFYREVARICAQQCENELEQNGIRAIVTNRVKRSDRVRKKIEARNKKKHYRNFEDISNDVMDLAGVRIALYFPADQTEVDRIIKNGFEVLKIIEFPKPPDTEKFKRSNPGYRAVHYRVRLQKKNLSDSQLKFLSANIEIQVASILMHAWAEVDHDLVYKSIDKAPSAEEIDILEELNGLVLLGEKVLNRLYKSIERRVERENFSNHYELAAHLYSLVKINPVGTVAEPDMGRTDILFRFLTSIDGNNPGFLQERVKHIRSDLPVVRQIVDDLIFADARLYDLFISAKQEVGARAPYDYNDTYFHKELTSNLRRDFLRVWIMLEKITDSIKGDKLSLLCNEDLITFARKWSLPDKDLMSLEKFKDLRNDLIHGLDPPSPRVLEEGIATLKGILTVISPSLPERLRTEIKRLKISG